jgi:hypothetical protein
MCIQRSAWQYASSVSLKLAAEDILAAYCAKKTFELPFSCPGAMVIQTPSCLLSSNPKTLWKECIEAEFHSFILAE